MPTVKLRDGDITLYTRGDSANWYAGYRLADGGRLQESLKTRNKAEAKERAIARYDELKWRKKLGPDAGYGVIRTGGGCVDSAPGRRSGGWDT